MRGDQLSRQWRILRRIEVSKMGLTASQIAQQAGVSLRTAYRDLDDLQSAGFPLYAEDGSRGKRWKLIETHHLKIPQPFTLTELLALHMGRDLFTVFKGTVFHDAVSTLVEKATAVLPPETGAYLDRMRSAFHMGRGPCKDYARFRELVNRVNSAAVDRRTIEIAYRGLWDQSAVVRRVDPYKIWFYEGSIYVIGLCHMREKIRTFVLDRIQMLNVTDDAFEVPRGFDFDAFIRNSFKVIEDELYTVRVQVSPAWARYIGEKTWHESQRIQKLFDGGIEVIFRVAGLEEIKQWVMSLGPEVYVVEPEELREKVSRELRETLRRYEPAGVVLEAPARYESLQNLARPAKPHG